MAYYWLTPPSRAVFFLSVLLAVLALLVRYAHIAIPVVSHYPFETLLVGFLLLLAGNLFKGFYQRACTSNGNKTRLILSIRV